MPFGKSNNGLVETSVDRQKQDPDPRLALGELEALTGTRLGPRAQAIDGALEGDPGDLAVDFSEPGGNAGSRALGGQAPDAQRPPATSLLGP